MPTNIDEALKALSAAHGPKALAGAHARLLAEVRRSRRAAKADEGILWPTIREALRLRDIQKADGVPAAEIAAGLETAVRLAWPKSTDRGPWVEGCVKCRGYGLEMHVCEGDTLRGPTLTPCDRDKPHLPHDYGYPCTCPKGDRFRRPDQLRPQQPQPSSKPSKPFSRIGR